MQANGFSYFFLTLKILNNNLHRWIESFSILVAIMSSQSIFFFIFVLNRKMSWARNCVANRPNVHRTRATLTARSKNDWQRRKGVYVIRPWMEVDVTELYQSLKRRRREDSLARLFLISLHCWVTNKPREICTISHIDDIRSFFRLIICSSLYFFSRNLSWSPKCIKKSWFRTRNSNDLFFLIDVTFFMVIEFFFCSPSNYIEFLLDCNSCLYNLVSFECENTWLMTRSYNQAPYYEIPPS